MGASLCHAQTFLFILLLFSNYWCSCLATNPIATSANNKDYIKISCDTTLYPQLCFQYLSPYADKIQTSPKLLANTSLSIALSATRSTSSMIENLSNTSGLNPTEKAALLDCVEELSDSVYELQGSMKEMAKADSGGSNFKLLMSDIETWTSAALTDDDTCTDGFEGNAMNGQVKTIVLSHVGEIEQLTSIALAFINNYAAT
ncbi:unnamed protein product [Ilex paraguariensis]|uniref:Pectinesterase inhibitor domain-containing protein n=1 Tax=Ilex paraguariensis TaxID=185542 RepID=A0ABC8TSX9_9AQUA